MAQFTKKNVFTIALINARSLKNKLNSFNETLNELGADVAVVTESWFKSTDPSINSILEDFTNKNGYGFLRKDRQTNKRGGGLVICFNSLKIQLCKAKIPPTKHEVYAAIGRRKGQRRKIIVLAIYIPPTYNSDQNKSLFKYTNDAILALKSKYEDPYIIVAGDFNRRDFNLATAEYPDIKPVLTEPTRGAAILDIIGSNMNDTVIDQGVTAAIRSDEGVESDHWTVFVQFRMPRVPSYNIESYTYLHMDSDSHETFGRLLREADWSAIEAAENANDAIEKLQDFFEKAKAISYEEKTRKKKTSEPGWMTDWLRDEIEDRRKVFKTDKDRSPRWQALKKRIARQVKQRKKKHNDYIIQKFESEQNPGKFFHHVQCLMGNAIKERWSPQQMFPGEESGEVAEKLAAFFNNISSQYRPLDRSEVPVTFDRQLPVLTEEQVVKKIKLSKKPTSTVPGDIPSVLYKMYPRELAKPITAIFNKITRQSCWPDKWKIEYVTVIPKVRDPQQPSDCRNISCTNYLSKLYESFVMDWSREEVRPDHNQYGGEKNASATQLLIEVISDVTTALEDNRAGVVLSAIDFSKAFNRLDHQKCLQSFANKGASTQVLNLLASFLQGRTMTVKVGQTKSTPKPVNAGAPQGSVLGCYLFNIGIDDLEKGVNLEGTGQEEAHEETLVRTDDFPAASTPQRIRPTEEPPESPIGAGPQDFDLLPRVANVKT